MDDIKDTVGNNDSPATTLVSTITTVTGNGTNITQITPQTLDNFEPDPKWEMTTLEKASYEPTAQEQDNNVYDSCILSQSSVDTDMEKVIDDIVELDRCQQFDQPPENHPDPIVDKQKEVDNDMKIGVGGDEPTISKTNVSDQLENKTTNSVNNEQQATSAMEIVRSSTNDLKEINDAELVPNAEDIKQEKTSQMDTTTSNQIAETCQPKSDTTDLAVVNPLQEHDDKKQEVAETVAKTNVDSVDTDPKTELDTTTETAEVKISVPPEEKAFEVEQESKPAVTDEKVVESEVLAPAIIEEIIDDGVEEVPCNIVEDTTEIVKNLVETNTTEPKQLESADVNTICTNDKPTETTDVVTNDSTVLVEEVIQTTEIEMSDAVEAEIELDGETVEGIVEEPKDQEEAVENSDATKVLKTESSDITHPDLAKTTEVGESDLCEKSGIVSSDANDQEVKAAQGQSDTEKCIEIQEEEAKSVEDPETLKEVEESVDESEIKNSLKRENPNVESKVDCRRRSKRARVERKPQVEKVEMEVEEELVAEEEKEQAVKKRSKVEKEPEVEVEQEVEEEKMNEEESSSPVDDEEKHQEMSKLDETSSANNEVKSGRPVRSARLRTSKPPEPLESTKIELEKRPVKRSLAKDYERDDTCQRSSKSGRLASSRMTIASSNPTAPTREPARRASDINDICAPYKCTHCNYVSSRVDNLIYHMKLKTCEPLKKMWKDYCDKTLKEMQSPKSNKKRTTK